MRTWLSRFLAVLMVASMSTALHAQTQDPHTAYWKKYGGMPPLDIRVSLNGQIVPGLFEQAQAESKGMSGRSLDSITIPLVTGQRVNFKVEVSKRDADQWFDVTQHANLILTNPTGGIQIEKKTKQISVLGDLKNPQTDFGYASISIYYTDSNPADEQFGFTRLYVYIGIKP